MPQNEYMERHRKLHGRRMDAEERERKREARQVHERSYYAKRIKGIRAKMMHKARYAEKAAMKRTIREHEERGSQAKKEAKGGPDHPVPAMLMERQDADRQKVLANTIKQKSKEKAAKWSVPIPKVKMLPEDEMFRVQLSGKRKSGQWKRVIPKACYVGETFTRKPPKYERFIRPMGMRFKKAHVTHPELKRTFCLPIVGVKHNVQSKMYTTLGVITKGTILEVNVSELGLVTPGGKVVWAKYAQVTNHPENDGVINALLLV
jgi:ribosome biogenesis protein NSA2